LLHAGCIFHLIFRQLRKWRAHCSQRKNGSKQLPSSHASALLRSTNACLIDNQYLSQQLTHSILLIIHPGLFWLHATLEIEGAMRTDSPATFDFYIHK
jgi:hypothetical protein